MGGDHRGRKTIGFLLCALLSLLWTTNQVLAVRLERLVFAYGELEPPFNPGKVLHCYYVSAQLIRKKWV